MIHIAPRHLDLLKKLLSPYDCSFYLIGSRLSAKAKLFSDIDLLYFEELPNPALYPLEEALEESDLPYKVDLVYYSACDDAFKQLIKKNYICIQASSKLKAVEHNHALHFQCFPKALGYSVVANPEAVSYINCGLGSSLFNIAYGKPSLQGALNEIETSIEKAIHHFQGQPFAWWIPPSQRDPDFSKALTQAGFIVEADEEAMFCRLDTIGELKPKTDLCIKPVQNKALLKEFIDLFSFYDSSASIFYEKFSESHLSLKERLFMGLEGGLPVALASVFYSQNSVGIFNLLTREDKRRQGYGTDILFYILEQSKAQGFAYATLSASSQAWLSLYEGVGFKSLGAFECFEYRGSPVFNPSL